MAETSNDPIDAIAAMIDGQISSVNTALPGVIVSYADGLAVVQPQGKKRFSDGDELDYPQVYNVPVSWPSFAGGQAGIKGPILPGDKCLLVFSQQAIDGSDDMRMHDLTDAYAVMSDMGNVGASGENDVLVMYYGSAFIQIDANGAINIEAPGGMTINGKVVQSGGELSSNGIVLDSHKHSGVQSGSSQTGAPV